MKYIHQYISVLAGALTFFIVGNQLGTVSPYLDILKDKGYNKVSNISDGHFSMLTSTLTIGILPGAVISTYANDGIGRKYSMMVMTLPAFLAQVFQYFAVHVTMVYVSIFLRGVICAWGFSAVPTYVSEIASAHLRGPFTVFCVLFVSIGMFAGSLIQASVSIANTAIINAIGILVILVILCFISESPHYYLLKYHDEKCKQVLRRFRNVQDVEEEFDEIKAEITESQLAKQIGWFKIFTVRSNLKAFLICAGVQSVQQFTGHLVMSTNIHTIVKNSGLGLNMVEISCIVNSVGIIATIASIFVVDSWGRKPLFIFVSSGACVGHLITAIAYILEATKVGSHTGRGITELVGNLIYIFMVGLGLMHLPNVLGAELFPTDIRSKGCSLLMVVASIEGVVVAQSFVQLIKFYYFIPFCFMSAFAFLGIVFGIIWVPETKNKTLEDIQKLLKA